MCSLSPGAPRGVPGEGLSVQSVSWYSERGARGRPVCLVCLLVLREGCQGKACLSSLSPGTPRGVPGEGLSVVCLLVPREGCQGKACLSGLSPGTPRGVPGEGLSV